MNEAYVCTQLVNTVNGIVCRSWAPVSDVGYKLTYEQMGIFILAITSVYASVFAIKAVKRSFF